MTKSITSAVCFFLLAASALSAVNIQNRCVPVWYDKEQIAFDLNQVRASSDSKPDRIDGSGIKADFQLCNPLTVNQADPAWNCDNKPNGNLAFILDSDNKCSPMTNDASTLKHELIKDDEEVKGIRMIYSNEGSQFSYKNKNLKITIMCNKDIDNSKIQWTVDDSDPSYISFSTAAKAGCGTSLKDLISLFNNFKIVAAGIILVVGILFTFFGKRFFTITLTTTGFLIGFIAVAGTAYVLGAMNNADGKKIGVVLFIAFLLGVLVGWLFYKFKVLTTIGAVGILSYFIGSAIVTLYLARWVHNEWGQLGIRIAFVVIGVGFGYFFSKHCIMFSTSFGGSFLIVLALGIATNTYLSPQAIYEKVRRQEKVVYPYVWGGLWLALGIVGFIIQEIRHNSKKDEEDDEHKLGSDGYSDYKQYH